MLQVRGSSTGLCARSRVLLRSSRGTLSSVRPSLGTFHRHPCQAAVTLVTELDAKTGEVCRVEPESSVSVCMATHNGGKFVREQICSILAQLSADDELVITDDCSTDDTIQIISDIGDSRIDLWRSPIHLGHVGAFTNSMQRAGGEIVLLADQDDIWLPHRVELFRAAFHDPAPTDR